MKRVHQLTHQVLHLERSGRAGFAHKAAALLLADESRRARLQFVGAAQSVVACVADAIAALIALAVARAL
eukprot:690779-Prymnesium_polylepis.1